jgi:hypothetical protein
MQTAGDNDTTLQVANPLPGAADVEQTAMPSLRVKGYLPPPGAHHRVDWFSERSVTLFCWGAMAAVVAVCAYLVYRGLQVFGAG